MTGGYDADWFRNALIDMGISPCIPSRAGHKVPIPHDTELYRLRHRIESMIRPNQGLATHCNPIRPLPDPVSLGLRPGRHRHLLVVSPDSGLRH